MYRSHNDIVSEFGGTFLQWSSRRTGQQAGSLSSWSQTRYCPAKFVAVENAASAEREGRGADCVVTGFSDEDAKMRIQTEWELDNRCYEPCLRDSCDEVMRFG